MLKGESKRTMCVCVDSYDDEIIGGRVYHSTNRRAKQFHGLAALLLTMDKCLDSVKFPQAFDVVRSFGFDEEEELIEDDMEIGADPNGGLATFTIRILFRQNASWQGSIAWLEGGYEESFRSALELVFLIHGVLSGRDNTEVPA